MQTFDDLYDNLSKREDFASIFGSKEGLEEYLKTGADADSSMKEMFGIENATSFLKKKEEAPLESQKEEESFTFQSPSVGQTEEVVGQIQTGLDINNQDLTGPGPKPSEIFKPTGRITSSSNRNAFLNLRSQQKALYDELIQIGANDRYVDPQMAQAKMRQYAGIYKQLGSDPDVQEDFDVIVNTLRRKFDVGLDANRIDVKQKGTAPTLAAPNTLPTPKQFEEQKKEMEKVKVIDGKAYEEIMPGYLIPSVQEVKPTVDEKESALGDYLDAYKNRESFGFAEKLYGVYDVEQMANIAARETQSAANLDKTGKAFDNIFKDDILQYLSEGGNNVSETFFYPEIGKRQLTFSYGIGSLSDAGKLVPNSIYISNKVDEYLNSSPEFSEENAQKYGLTKDELKAIAKPRLERIATQEIEAQFTDMAVQKKLADKKIFADETVGKEQRDIESDVSKIVLSTKKKINDYQAEVNRNITDWYTTANKEAEVLLKNAYDETKAFVETDPYATEEEKKARIDKYNALLNTTISEIEQQKYDKIQQAKKDFEQYSMQLGQSAQSTIDKQLKEKYGLAYDLNRGQMTTEAYRKYSDAYNQAYDEVYRDQLKANEQLGLGGSLIDVIQSRAGTMFSGAINALSATVGYENNPLADLLKYTDFVANKSEIERKSFSDVIDESGLFSSEAFRSAVLQTAEQTVNMGPVIAATALTANPWIGGAVGWSIDTAEQIGQNYRDIFNQTGSVQEAEKAARTTFTTQAALIPTYALMAAPFAKGFLSSITKGTGLFGFAKKAGVATAIEAATETTQEVVQNYLSYALSTNNPDSFTTYALKNGIKTAIDIAPSTVFFGTLGAVSETRTEAKVEAAKARVKETLGDGGLSQIVLDAIQVLGEKGSAFIPEYLFQRQLIDESQLRDMKMVWSEVIKTYPAAKEVIKDADNQKYYISLATQKAVWEARSKAQGVTDSVKLLLEARAKELGKKMADIAAGKKVEYSKIYFNDKYYMVVDNAELLGNLSRDKFQNDLVDGKVRVETQDAEIKNIVDKMQAAAQEQARVEQQFVAEGAQQVSGAVTNIENLGTTVRDDAKLEQVRQKAAQAGQKNADVLVENAKTLQGLLDEVSPGVNIVLLNNAEFGQAMGSLGADAKRNGNFFLTRNPETGKFSVQIQINLDKANDTTIQHEVSHALLLSSLGSDPKLFDEMRKSLDGIVAGAIGEKQLGGLNDLIGRYRESQQSEEFLVELAAYMATEGTTLELGTLQKIAKVISDFVSKITNGKIQLFETINTRQGFIDYMNSLSQSLQSGKATGALAQTAAQPSTQVTPETAPMAAEQGVGTQTQVPTTNRAQATEVFNGILDKIGIQYGVESKTGKRQVKNIDVAKALNKYYKEKFKTIKVGDFGKKTLELVSDYATDEIIFALERFGNESGKGWYTEDFNKALETLAQLDETIVNDPAVREIVTVAIAVASNSTDVSTNLKKILYAAEEFKKTGKIPTDIGVGTAASAVATSIKRYNNLLENYFNNDVNALKEFLQTTRSIAESQKAVMELAGVNTWTKAMDLGIATKPEWNTNEILPTSIVIFGPKIGAFYSNLSGLGGTPTIDRWCIRTMYRYYGDMMSKVLPSELDAFVKQENLQGLSKGNVINVLASHAKIFKQIMADKGITKEQRNEKLTRYRKGYTLYEKMVGVVNEISDGLTEKIENAAQYEKDFRSFTKKAFESAQQKIKERANVDLEISDIQAILWIFEKNLFGYLGVKQKQDSTYSSASFSIVEKVKNGEYSLDSLKKGIIKEEKNRILEDMAMGDNIAIDENEYINGVEQQRDRLESNATEEASINKAQRNVQKLFNKDPKLENEVYRVFGYRSEFAVPDKEIDFYIPYQKIRMNLRDITVEPEGDVDFTDVDKENRFMIMAKDTPIGYINVMVRTADKVQVTLSGLYDADKLTKRTLVQKIVDLVDRLIPRISTTNEEFNVNAGKGVGRIAYEVLAIKLKNEYGKTLTSDDTRSYYAENLWNKFEKEGKAKVVGYRPDVYDWSRQRDYYYEFTFDNIIPADKKKEIQTIYGEYLDTTGKPTLEGFREYVAQTNPTLGQPTMNKAQLDNTQISTIYNDSLANSGNTNSFFAKADAYAELLSKGYSRKNIIEQLGQGTFDEDAYKEGQNKIALKTMTDVGALFESRQEQLKNLMQTAFVYENLVAQGFTALEIFTAARDMNVYSNAELASIFGADYRETVQKALNDKQYPADFLDELSSDAQNLKVTQHAEEVVDILRQTGVGLVDSAVTVQAFLVYLNTNGFSQLADLLTDEVAKQLQAAKVLDPALDWTDAVRNGIVGDGLYSPEAFVTAFQTASELFSQSGRILQMARKFKTEVGTLGLIEKNLAKYNVVLTEKQKEQLNRLVNDYNLATEEHTAALKELQEDWSDQAFDRYMNAEKALGEASIRIAMFLEAKKPIFWNERITSGGSRALLNFSTTVLSFVANVENMFLSTNPATKRVQKITDWVRGGIQGTTLSIKNWRMARRLTKKRTSYMQLNAAKYGTMSTAKQLNNYYDNLAQINFFKDPQWVYNFFKVWVLRSAGKPLSQMTDEEVADALDLTLIKLKNGEIELRDGKSYTLARSLAWSFGVGPVSAIAAQNPSMLLASFGPAATELTGRAMAYGGDILFGSMAAQRAMIDYLDTFKDVQFQGGVLEPLVRNANGNLNEQAIRALSTIIYNNGELYARFEEMGLARTLLADNWLSSNISKLRGSIRKAVRKRYYDARLEIPGTGIAGELKRQATFNGLAKAALQIGDVGLWTLMPFTKVPVNFLGSAIVKTVPAAAVARFTYSSLSFEAKNSRFQKRYPANVQLKTAKDRLEYEKAKIDLFAAKRQATYDAAQLVTSFGIYLFAQSAIASGALLVGDDEEKQKAARNINLRGGLYNATLHWEYMLSKIPFTTNKNFLAKRGGYAKKGDIILDVRNLGFLGYGMNLWGSVEAKEAKEVQNQLVGLVDKQTSGIWASLHSLLGNGIENLPMFQGVARLADVFNEAKKGESTGKIIENYVAGTLSTSAAVLFPSFFSFMAKGNAEMVQSANEINTLREDNSWPASFGPIVVKAVQRLNRNFSFNNDTRNQYYQAQVGPFGEDLSYKVTLDEPGSFWAYLQAVFDPFSVRLYNASGKEHEKQKELYLAAATTFSGYMNLALIFQQMTGRDYEFKVDGKTTPFYDVITNPMKNSFAYSREVTISNNDAVNTPKFFNYELPFDLYRKELQIRGQRMYNAYGSFGKEIYEDDLEQIRKLAEAEKIKEAKKIIVDAFSRLESAMQKAKIAYEEDYHNNREKQYFIEMKKRNLLTPDMIQKMKNVGIMTEDGLIP